MIAVLALALSLQLAPHQEEPAFEAHPPLMSLKEGSAPTALRSWAWVPAGGYGFATFGAGLAAVVADQTRDASPRAEAANGARANRAMAVGGLLALLPGLIFGQEARYEENARTRAAMPILDVLGTLTLGIGIAISHGGINL